jgi:hypothetical protein
MKFLNRPNHQRGTTGTIVQAGPDLRAGRETKKDHVAAITKWIAMLVLGMAGVVAPLPAQSNFPITPSGLKYLVLEYGTGPLVRPGRTVTVHLVGKLRDGTVFEDTRKKNQPVTFRLSEGEVMAGWVEGFRYFHGGDKGIIVVPAALAKGGKPLANVPADKELVFEIEVVDVKEK